MPSIDDNKRVWDSEYDWRVRGDEWSVAWGGPSMQWYGALLPRIHSHVPTDCVLEIGCGYGRWTHYLKDLCTHLIAVDLSEECVTACRRRFANCDHIEYYVNNGKSLDMVLGASVDFVFSFDSLVHADDSVLSAYISQFKRILTDNGVAFIHHSNLGEYQATYTKIKKIPKLAGLLSRLGVGRLGALTRNVHWRDRSVDARKVASFAEENELSCISQEIIPWATPILSDCISRLVNRTTQDNKLIVKNYEFNEEIKQLLRLSKIYI
jgi:SAM-dependent methyltransferase